MVVGEKGLLRADGLEVPDRCCEVDGPVERGGRPLRAGCWWLFTDPQTDCCTLAPLAVGGGELICEGSCWELLEEEEGKLI